MYMCDKYVWQVFDKVIAAEPRAEWRRVRASADLRVAQRVIQANGKLPAKCER